MTTYITPSSGHTIMAPHIEKPVNVYYVQWHAPILPSAVCGVLFSETTRWACVLAETEEGALKVTRYHHFTGDSFQLLPNKPE